MDTILANGAWVSVAKLVNPILADWVGHLTYGHNKCGDVKGCVRSLDHAVALRSATAPRARLMAKSRIIARGISRLQRCLSANATPLRMIGLCAEAPVLLDIYTTYYVGTW